MQPYYIKKWVMACFVTGKQLHVSKFFVLVFGKIVAPKAELVV